MEPRKIIQHFRNSQRAESAMPPLNRAIPTSGTETDVVGDARYLRGQGLNPRSGWAEGSRNLVAIGNDALILDGFANEADARLRW